MNSKAVVVAATQKRATEDRRGCRREVNKEDVEESLMVQPEDGGSLDWSGDVVEDHRETTHAEEDRR